MFLLMFFLFSSSSSSSSSSCADGRGSLVFILAWTLLARIIGMSYTHRATDTGLDPATKTRAETGTVRGSCASMDKLRQKALDIGVDGGVLHSS
ncbi:hypothetical protein BDF14DRAFT_1768193 [Spinellus fusiger]|nr:hypothetical protein BDF14DRAFT_1768193 [Spinellus fusiger]